MCPAAVKITLFITQQNNAHNICICIYLHVRLLATMSPLSFYVLYYGSQHFSGLNKKENVANRSSFYIVFRCFEIYFKY